MIQSHKVGFPIHENVTPKPNRKSFFFYLFIFIFKFDVQLSLFQWVRNHGTWDWNQNWFLTLKHSLLNACAFQVDRRSLSQLAWVRFCEYVDNPRFKQYSKWKCFVKKSLCFEIIWYLTSKSLIKILEKLFLKVAMTLSRVCGIVLC